jgi:hypothetical protein
MLEAALVTRDEETIKLLVDQATQLGREGSALIERTMRGFLDKQDIRAAVSIIQQCEHKVLLPQNLCNAAAVGAANDLRWTDAFLATKYLIDHDMQVSNRLVYFTVSGLLNQPEGLFKVLELTQLIIDKERADLASQLEFGKVRQHTRHCA